jgi:3',5'-cyclic AMP phosphodiesterase CpdA
VRVVCISDTHNRHARVAVPSGDLLIHAGDFTVLGKEDEIADFNRWLATLPHRHKIVIAGNHEFLFERDPARARRLITNAVYLEDAALRVDGLALYGSPWQPMFGGLAFNLPRGADLAAKWALIPPGTDILVTHGPPYGHVDALPSGRHVGDVDLAAAIAAVKPRLHVCGHIHQGYGTSQIGGTTCVNASICNESYDPVNAPVVVDL